MIVPVEKLFDRIEDQRKKVLEEAGKLSHEQQNFCPEPGKWSILQVFNHLITAETNSLKYMSKKIQGIGKVKKAGLPSMIRSAGLNLFLRLPVKYKAPNVVNVSHDHVYILENQVEQWEELRSGFSKFLDQLDPDSANKLLFRHPVAGRMNIYQTLTFFFEHMEHHKKQIARIKAHPNFPA